MISDENVRQIALFYLFTLMDEKVALQAAHKTIAQLKAANSKSGWSKSTVVKALARNYASHRKTLPRHPQNASGSGPEAAMILPSGVDFSVWKRFSLDASEPETIVVVLVNILGFKEEDVAEGLGISLGTVRYRLGKGISQMAPLLSEAAGA
jgi:DNA-directed RNA polymerase specialized sigma24 family protein